jgi:lysophospholipase L1-like esterase
VSDDSLMDRFEENARRFRARDALVAIGVAALVLAVVLGASMPRAAHELRPSAGRALVLGVDRPVGWMSRNLPVHTFAARLTAHLSPDPRLAAGGRFGTQGRGATTGQVPVVTRDAFDPTMLGTPAPPRRALHTLLVTGDSLSTPLDIQMARGLARAGVRVLREPHLGTGISKTDLVDWGRLSTSQVRADRPDAVVVFIGANEGFPMPGPSGRPVACCGPDWAAAYANRVRQVMHTYGGSGARVYWLTVPAPREPARQRIERVVNAAVTVAAEPWRTSVHLIDSVPIFTPGGRYRDAMPVGGRQTLVRESDGIHLNNAGSSVLATVVLAALSRDFRY